MAVAMMPVMASPEPVELAEGPVWDCVGQRLLWVDINGGTVFEGQLLGVDIHITRRHQFDTAVGAVVPGPAGSLLVAADTHLVVVTDDGRVPVGPPIIGPDEHRRLNDGGTDPAGRFVVGSLSTSARSKREVLVRLESDATVTTLDDDLSLSNGLAWSSDGTRMYSVDSERQCVFIRDYDPASGAVGQRRHHLAIDDGYPDGIALDADEHLWVAVWGAGEVRRYAPDGTIMTAVPVSAPHTSSVAFAGGDLRTLVITTAYENLTAEQHEQWPMSGRLFTVRTEVPGLPTIAWSGVQ